MPIDREGQDSPTASRDLELVGRAGRSSLTTEKERRPPSPRTPPFRPMEARLLGGACVLLRGEEAGRAFLSGGARNAGPAP